MMVCRSKPTHARATPNSKFGKVLFHRLGEVNWLPAGGVKVRYQLCDIRRRIINDQGPMFTKTRHKPNLSRIAACAVYLCASISTAFGTTS